MKKFKEITEASGQIIFTFGRFNPPTTGHEKLIEKVASVAGSNPFRIYPSQSQNPKKDPLPHTLKVAYMRKMFPKYKTNIVAGREKTVFEIVTKLHSEGYTDIVMVVGSDRVKEFDSLLKKYNGVNGRHGFYDFRTIGVMSAGERDPDAEGVTGMSASKMRAAAVSGDFDSFKTGLPSGFRDALKLYNDVRKYMGIREERDMGEMTDFETLRDMYLTGKIWNVGDIVEANGVKGKVIRKGTNYLSFVDEDNKVHKAWLYDIDEQKKITRVKQDPDLKDKEGTEPAKYYAKGAGGKDMATSTKVARKRQFAKQTKMADDDPDAYKPAPGDKGKKTKPSQYTKKYKQMYGEKLGKDADAGDYIDDFRKSKAPQFKGKSDKKIRDMAIAAYLDAKDKKEETDMKFYQIDEKIAGLVKKSKQTGVPYGILKKSYDRGMAAWKTGHRPGTTPQQWAFARVNSMLTGGKADPDLQPKARAAKKKHKASKKKEEFGSVQEWFEANRVRAKYQLNYGDDWWWKLNEVHDAMLEKIGADCCDDCGEELDEEVLPGHKVQSVEYKFKDKNEAMKAKKVLLKYFNEVDDEDINRGVIIADAGNRDMNKAHEEIMKKFRPKVLSGRKINRKGNVLDMKEELDEAMYHHVLKGKIVGSGSKAAMMKSVKRHGKTVRKGPDSNYVLNSPGAKIGDIKEQPEHEITVGNYTTKFFYMCGSAQDAMKKAANEVGAESLTRLQDDFFSLEKQVMDAGQASDEQKEKAKSLYNQIMMQAGKLGLADEIDGYMKQHIDSIEKGDPEPGFGRTDIDESLWANIHKKRQRIKRGSGERMRKKGEKGAPTAAQMRRAKGEELMDYIERKMSTLRKDKDLPNLRIPKKGKAGVTKFQRRAGGRTRLDSPYTMMLRNSWGEVTEAAEYQGRKVQLNNPTRGDVKKFKVFVKNDKGNVVKVEFGDPNMEIKRDDPARRKSFRARHNCDNPGPKYKARYWSCKFWEKGKSVTDLMKG